MYKILPCLPDPSSGDIQGSPPNVTVRYPRGNNKSYPSFGTRSLTESTTCQDCGSKFGILTHKHTCRFCGNVFCSKCVQEVKGVYRCETCRVPRFFQLDLTVLKHMFAYMSTRTATELMMTCKYIQCNLPLTDLEYKNIWECNFANRVQIGRGGCGTVYRCEQENGTKLAVKIVHKSSVTNMYVWKRVMMEIEIMRMMDHSNIVKLVDAFQTKQDVVIITEYAEGGTLRNAVDYMRKKSLNMEHFAAHIMSQLCSALSYMWSVHGVAHRDLKMDNIVLSRDFSKVYVIDFGLAEFSKPPPDKFAEADLDTVVKKYVPCGTAGYASPENINAVFAKPACRLTATALTMHKCDMYSLGVILWFVLTGSKLFRDIAFKRVRAEIEAGIKFDGEPWTGRTRDARNACAALLERVTAARVTADAFARNAWVVNGSLEFQALQNAITAEMTTLVEGEGSADDDWVFIQYGGFVESSWVLLYPSTSESTKPNQPLSMTKEGIIEKVTQLCQLSAHPKEVAASLLDLGEWVTLHPSPGQGPFGQHSTAHVCYVMAAVLWPACTDISAKRIRALGRWPLRGEPIDWTNICPATPTYWGAAKIEDHGKPILCTTPAKLRAMQIDHFKTCFSQPDIDIRVSTLAWEVSQSPQTITLLGTECKTAHDVFDVAVQECDASPQHGFALAMEWLAYALECQQRSFAVGKPRCEEARWGVESAMRGCKTPGDLYGCLVRLHEPDSTPLKPYVGKGTHAQMCNIFKRFDDAALGTAEEWFKIGKFMSDVYHELTPRTLSIPGTKSESEIDRLKRELEQEKKLVLRLEVKLKDSKTAMRGLPKSIN